MVTMFGNRGIQPVQVTFNNAKNCFLHLPSKLVAHLSLSENQALELSWGHDSSVFLSWTQSRISSTLDDHKVELCRQLGERLGLRDGEQGFLRLCQQVSSVHQVLVEPVSSDDWEILELHSAALEQQLLDQIRVVFRDAVLPVWVDHHTAIYIQIASLKPSVPYGRLEQFTELVVSPKSRAPFENNSWWPNSTQEQHLSGQVASEDRSSSRSSSPRPSTLPDGKQRGGLADLRNLLRYLIKGPSEPVVELPPVPDVPALFIDALYRVCTVPPSPVCAINSIATAVVHVFALSHGRDAAQAGGQSAVTYGLLSKVPSPKESRERLKRGLEKKKNAAPSDVAADRAGVEVKEEEKDKEDDPVVVRIVCHWTESLTGSHRKGRGGGIHSGRVWISPYLAEKLNILPHSTVRIKPVTSPIAVASAIRLQPLRPLPDEDDEAVRTTFLGWLHTRSHEPLACLTTRSDVVLLHGNDAKLKYALTVLRPEPKSDPPDQLFLLAPTVLQKNIEVSREPRTEADMELVTAPPRPELSAPLSSLGGMDDLSRTAFEFITHSLLGSPLSRLFCAAGQGLGGGAFLITGPKGSGKSALSGGLCRKAMEVLDAHVEMMDCKKLQGKRLETVRRTLQDVFEQAEWMQPSVILLDGLDHICGAPTSAEHEHGPEALLQQHIAQSLRDLVDEHVVHSSLVCLIITSQSEHSLHASLTEGQGSHFIQGFAHIQPPDQAQRAAILRCLINRRATLSEEGCQNLDLSALAKEMEGYTPQDLVVVLERAVHASAIRGGHSDEGVCLTRGDFAEALKGFTPPSLWGMDLHVPSGVGLEKVGGLKEVREQLMDTILLPAKYPILFANLPIRHRSGILLYGAPGTGKTLLARAVAKDSGMNFISIKGPELLSKYIGASEQGVRDVFQRAQAAKPCILFFDEFDSLAPRRGHDNTGVTDRVVNQLLTQLDGVEGLQGVYVLAATSRPDLIDPALLRPGRLDKSLYCPPPDQEARVEILRALSADVPLAADVDLEQLAAATHQFTGADLKALLYNAQLEAVHSSLPNSSPHCDGQELTSISDSDMSLSSMVFPNHSSGSDDSAGDGETSREQSLLLPDHGNLQVECEHHSSAWRLYFGSPYPSDLGNSPLSGLNSQCVSGPNSMSHDLAGSSLHDSAGPPAPLAYMPSIRKGLEELGPEQLERLQQDVKTIKGSYRRTNDSFSRPRPASAQSSLLIHQTHLNAALATTRPSLGKADWMKYTKLYEAFGDTGSGKSQNSCTFKPGQRVTLA